MTTTSLSVSVVIPTHQRCAHVTTAVRSVLTQDLLPDEVIVVDDGSTDGTAGALARFGDRVRCLRKENGGVASARNAGLRAATGDVVAFLDDDDRWLAGHLSALVQALASHPQALGASTGAGQNFGAVMFGPEPVVVEPLPRLLIGNFIGFPSCTSVRRTALLEAGGFDESLLATDSYDLWLRLAALGPACLMSRRTVVRRRLSDSLGSTGAASGRFLEERARVGAKLQAQLAPVAPALRPGIESYRRFVAALQAFDAGRVPAASDALLDVCRLTPAWSDEPWLVGGWLSHLRSSCTPAGRLSAFRWAANAWPDPACTTAVGVRLHGAYLALRSGHPRVAAGLLGRRPRGPLVRLAAEVVPRLLVAPNNH